MHLLVRNEFKVVSCVWQRAIPLISCSRPNWLFRNTNIFTACSALPGGHRCKVAEASVSPTTASKAYCTLLPSAPAIGLFIVPSRVMNNRLPMTASPMISLPPIGAWPMTCLYPALTSWIET